MWGIYRSAARLSVSCISEQEIAAAEDEEELIQAEVRMTVCESCGHDSVSCRQETEKEKKREAWRQRAIKRLQKKGVKSLGEATLLLLPPRKRKLLSDRSPAEISRMRPEVLMQIVNIDQERFEDIIDVAVEVTG